MENDFFHLYICMTHMIFNLLLPTEKWEFLFSLYVYKEYRIRSHFPREFSLSTTKLNYRLHDTMNNMFSIVNSAKTKKKKKDGTCK